MPSTETRERGMAVQASSRHAVPHRCQLRKLFGKSWFRSFPETFMSEFETALSPDLQEAPQNHLSV